LHRSSSSSTVRVRERCCALPRRLWATWCATQGRVRSDSVCAVWNRVRRLNWKSTTTGKGWRVHPKGTRTMPWARGLAGCASVLQHWEGIWASAVRQISEHGWVCRCLWVLQVATVVGPRALI